jgi:hypothetical protein
MEWKNALEYKLVIEKSTFTEMELWPLQIFEITKTQCYAEATMHT